jgi:hypothetical protein
MCKYDNLDDLRTGKDFEHYVITRQCQGKCEVRHAKGDHVIVSNDKGTACFPSGHELGKGLRVKVVKALMAMGLALAGIGAVVLVIATA